MNWELLSEKASSENSVSPGTKNWILLSELMNFVYRRYVI